MFPIYRERVSMYYVEYCRASILKVWVISIVCTHYLILKGSKALSQLLSENQLLHSLQNLSSGENSTELMGTECRIKEKGYGNFHEVHYSNPFIKFCTNQTFYIKENTCKTKQILADFQMVAIYYGRW